MEQATANCEISIHALREEGDIQNRSFRVGQKISIHALREEGDRRWRSGCCGHCHFYPRPPRGGRLVSEADLEAHDKISIHALREEGDRLPGGGVRP